MKITTNIGELEVRSYEKNGRKLFYFNSMMNAVATYNDPDEKRNISFEPPVWLPLKYPVAIQPILYRNGESEFRYFGLGSAAPATLESNIARDYPEEMALNRACSRAMTRLLGLDTRKADIDTMNFIPLGKDEKAEEINTKRGKFKFVTYMAEKDCKRIRLESLIRVAVRLGISFEVPVWIPNRPYPAVSQTITYFGQKWTGAGNANPATLEGITMQYPFETASNRALSSALLSFFGLRGHYYTDEQINSTQQSGIAPVSRATHQESVEPAPVNAESEPTEEEYGSNDGIIRSEPVGEEQMKKMARSGRDFIIRGGTFKNCTLGDIIDAGTKETKSFLQFLLTSKNLTPEMQQASNEYRKLCG